MKISVAIPETSLSDESLKSAKTRKASVIARACSIFGIDTIYVYKEGGRKSAKSDAGLLVTTLRYVETPQFLRKRLFPHLNNLKFAGMTLPLQIPSHATPKGIRRGQIREGVVVVARGGRFVDAGAERLLRYTGKAPPGRRITVIIRATEPYVKYDEIKKEQIDQYRGYSVRSRASLQSLLAEWKGQTIITSRKGRPVVITACGSRARRRGGDDIQDYMRHRHHHGCMLRDDSDLLVVFGSPERGVHDILGGGINSMSAARILNFFPGQQTATVRLEEAIMGVLAMVNAEAGASGGEGDCSCAGGGDNGRSSSSVGNGAHAGGNDGGAAGVGR